MEDRPLDEVDLVARAKRGDPDAFGEIVQRHQAVAFRTAWLITRSAADAEEAVQDALLKAHRALGRFRERSPLRPGCLRSSPTRPVIAGPPPDGASGWRSAQPRSAARSARSRRPRRRSWTPSGEPSYWPRWSVFARAIAWRSPAASSSSCPRRRWRLCWAAPRGTVKSRLSRALDRLRDELGDPE